MMRALEEARVDTKSQAELIAALRSSDERLAFSAAYWLAYLPRTATSERALEEAFETGSENVSYWSAYSLASLGNNQWMPLAALRLAAMQRENLQLAMASLLASQGNFAGWFVVQRQSQTKYPLDAVVAAPRFVKMQNNGVDLVRILESLLLVAEEAQRPDIQWSLTVTRKLLALPTDR